MIPRVIHYFWFGRGPKSDIINKCMESWSVFATGWEIVEWNEDNFDVYFCERSRQAYEAGKWAFVADIARLKVLYEKGGVYMDTDVQLIAPLDDLVDCTGNAESFFLFLNERFIGTGVGFGAEPGSKVIKYLLDNYVSMTFELKRGVFNKVCTQIETEALERYYPEFIRNNETQCFPDNTIMLSTKIWSLYSIHIGTGTWVDGGRTNFDNSKAGKHIRLKTWLRKPEHFKTVRKLFGEKAEYIYEFCTYDLLDMGFVYFVGRVGKRIKERWRRANDK